MAKKRFNTKFEQINEIQIGMDIQEVVRILDMVTVKLMSTAGVNLPGSIYFEIMYQAEIYYINFNLKNRVDGITNPRR